MSAPDSEVPPAWKAFTAGAEDGGQRLDQWLAAKLEGEMSRSRLQAVIRDGGVRIDGGLVSEPKRRVAPGMTVEVTVAPAEEAAIEPEDIPLDILFEDDQLIVVNKPPGLVVHPGAGNWSGTLVNALMAHCGDSLSGIGGVKRPGIVHRLDKETSGAMVVAKTDAAHRALAADFADHGRTGDLERGYHAIVWGAPARQSGTIEAALGRAADRIRRAVVPEEREDARHAVTHYEVLERYGTGENVLASLIGCRLETGRTHQVRVHLAHIGHPLIGDPDYGQGFRTKAAKLPEPARSAASGFGRQALHAWLLAFRHPASGELMRFEAPEPADLTALRAALAPLALPKGVGRHS